MITSNIGDINRERQPSPPRQRLRDDPAAQHRCARRSAAASPASTPAPWPAPKRALKDLSSQFGQWLQDEVGKLDAALHAVKVQGLNRETIDAALCARPRPEGPRRHLRIPDRRPASPVRCCRLLDNGDQRLRAPMQLVDAHVNAIRAAVRDGIRDTDHPIGAALSTELDRAVAEHLARQGPVHGPMLLRATARRPIEGMSRTLPFAAVVDEAACEAAARAECELWLQAMRKGPSLLDRAARERAGADQPDHPREGPRRRHPRHRADDRAILTGADLTTAKPLRAMRP